MEINEETLLMCNPIHIEDVGQIYQPIVNEISAMGRDNYLKLTLPFLITKDDLVDEYKNIDIYDLFFLEENAPLLQQLIIMLNLFFKQDIDIGVENNNIYFKIGEDGVVNKDNFNDISQIVREISCIKLPEPERLPKNMSAEQKRIHEKMKYHRNRRAELETPSFKEIINTVVHCGESFIPYKTVGEFTYYQLMNSYQVIVGRNNYDEFLRYKTSFKYDIQEDMPHWTKLIKMI